MADELPIATLLHISDLHFGRNITMKENEVKRWAAKLPLVQGIYAHSYAAAKALATRVNQFVAERKTLKVPVCVVFTGDLTRHAGKDEFNIGDTFLRGEHFTGATNPVGLKLGEPKEEIGPGQAGLFSIPGNHDIWGNYLPNGSAIYKNHFPSDFPTSLVIRTRNRPVVLHGLDSTQVGGIVNVALARGHVPTNDLKRVCTDLLKRESLGRLSRRLPEAIKIVCLHHPLSDHPKHPGTTYGVGMELNNRGEVGERLVEAGVDLVLAGHLHDEFSVDAVNEKGNERPNQAVAGSGTQQVADRSFFLIDIYSNRIEVFVWDYVVHDKDHTEFVEKDAPPKVFNLKMRRSREPTDVVKGPKSPDRTDVVKPRKPWRPGGVVI